MLVEVCLACGGGCSLGVGLEVGGCGAQAVHVSWHAGLRRGQRIQVQLREPAWAVALALSVCARDLESVHKASSLGVEEQGRLRPGLGMQLRSKGAGAVRSPDLSESEEGS